MNLFNSVRAFTRGRYAAHLFTRGIDGGKEMAEAPIAALSLHRAPHAAQTHSYNEQER